MPLAPTLEDVSIIEWALNVDNDGRQEDLRSMALRLYTDYTPVMSNVGDIIQRVDLAFENASNADVATRSIFYGTDLDIPDGRSSHAQPDLYYNTSIDPKMFPIGTMKIKNDGRTIFICEIQHCETGLNLVSVQDLHRHFTATHFAYKRMSDSRRLVCQACFTFSAIRGNACSNPQCLSPMPLLEKVYGKHTVEGYVSKSHLKAKRGIKDVSEFAIPDPPKRLWTSPPSSEAPNIFSKSSQPDSVLSSLISSLSSQSAGDSHLPPAKKRKGLLDIHRTYMPCCKCLLKSLD